MEPPPSELAIARLIGFALAGSVAILVVLAEVLQATGVVTASSVSGDAASFLQPIFIVVSVVQILAIRPLQRVIRSRPAGARDTPETRLLAATIVSLALCEGVAIYGFVLFVLTGRTNESYVFSILAAAFLAVHFPSEARWQQLLRTDPAMRV